jgi:hypothetical protein
VVLTVALLAVVTELAYCGADSSTTGSNNRTRLLWWCQHNSAGNSSNNCDYSIDLVMVMRHNRIDLETSS